MALSRIVAIGDGATRTFAVKFTLGYINPDYVTCRVGDEADGAGNPIYRTITWLSPTLAEISGTIPASGERVLFERTVTRDKLLVDYENNAIINEDNLNTMQKQMIMLVHEVMDGRFTEFVNDFDMGGFRITNLGDPVDPTDAVTKQYADQTVTAAEAYAVAAAASAGIASTKANEAAASAVTAGNSATGAVTARNFAYAWATAPQGTPVDDGINPTGYSAYHWAARAESWADADEDVPVEPGKYSAKHWAEKAEHSVLDTTASQIHAALGKTTPAAADELGLVDSASSWGLKKLTLTNLRAWLTGSPFVPVAASTNASDWDTLVMPGWFGQLAGGPGANSPGGSEDYFLHNSDYGSGYTLQQMAYPRRTVAGRIGLRTRHNDVWEGWRYLPWADTVLHLSGGTMTGKLTLPAAAEGFASLRIPQGVTPNVGNLVNGDLWLPASGGFYGRRGGVTVALWDTGSLVRPGAGEINAGVSTTERVWAAADLAKFVRRDRLVLGKSYDQSFATQTLADVTGLSFLVGANEVWAFEAEVLFEKTADSNAYPDVAVNGPVGANIRGFLHINMHQTNDLFGENAQITAFDQRPFTFALAGAVPGNVRLLGYIIVGATAGTVTIRGARNGTAGTATIKGGSILKAYRMS